LLYSAFSFTIPSFKEFDKTAKQTLRVKSLIGGPGPTFDWDCLKGSTIDAFCAGEGEMALLDYIQSGFRAGKNIAPQGSAGPSEFHPFAELDQLPFPDRDIVYGVDPALRNMPSKQFLSGRGCPYDCTYCFNHRFREIFKTCGSVIRKKSVRYLIDEIRLVQKKYPLLTVVFNDDTFILNKKWFLEFCERFPKEIGLPYTCNIRANLVDEEIAKALRDSGCIVVNWSIESGDEYMRNTVLKRQMSDAQIFETAAWLAKYKIRYRIGNIIGLPGESFDQMLKTLELNIKAKPSMGLANIFVPFPGLALTEYAIHHGHYTPSPGENIPNDFFTKSILKITPSENKAIQKLMCLFPIFVNFPFLYSTVSIRKTLFILPRLILKAVYELFFAIKMMRLYVSRADFSKKLRIIFRYLIDSQR